MNLEIIRIHCSVDTYDFLQGKTIYLRTNRIPNHTSEMIELIWNQVVEVGIYSFRIEISYHGDFIVTGFAKNDDSWLPISIVMRTK